MLKISWPLLACAILREGMCISSLHLEYSTEWWLHVSCSCSRLLSLYPRRWWRKYFQTPRCWESSTIWRSFRGWQPHDIIQAVHLPLKFEKFYTSSVLFSPGASPCVGPCYCGRSVPLHESTRWKNWHALPTRARHRHWRRLCKQSST